MKIEVPPRLTTAIPHAHYLLDNHLHMADYHNLYGFGPKCRTSLINNFPESLVNLPYQIVNHCLSELQHLNAPIITKLQIEIELLQVKRMLLLIGGACCSVVTEGVKFEVFEAAFRAACSSGVEENSAELLSLVKKLRISLTEASEVTSQPSLLAPVR